MHVTDNRGRTCLHIALQYRSIDLAKLFIERGGGMAIHVGTNHELTPLHVGAKFGSADGVKTLLASGEIDLQAKDV